MNVFSRMQLFLLPKKLRAKILEFQKDYKLISLRNWAPEKSQQSKLWQKCVFFWKFLPFLLNRRFSGVKFLSHIRIWTSLDPILIFLSCFWDSWSIGFIFLFLLRNKFYSDWKCTIISEFASFAAIVQLQLKWALLMTNVWNVLISWAPSLEVPLFFLSFSFRIISKNLMLRAQFPAFGSCQNVIVYIHR